ncbi:MAG: hypothetical protein IJK46_14765 [Prevotella sp.]|nr:hypothetical protein [Prevotella sp.]
MTVTISSLLYAVSVPGGIPDDGDPEAKQASFEEESECVYNLPSIDYDVWAEEEESDSYFKTK